MNETQQRVEEVFLAALELPDAGQCPAFLDRQCAGDPTLRAEVERYLAIQPTAERFFAEIFSPSNDTAANLSED